MTRRIDICQTAAAVLAKRILPNGDVEIDVPYEETFMLKGERVAYVNAYQCVRTSYSGGRAKQRHYNNKRAIHYNHYDHPFFTLALSMAIPLSCTANGNHNYHSTLYTISLSFPVFLS
ncbi:hypothetical protein BIW11_02428 [Tropilaelaps mercedesae]|uniref:Uncharacterized protein n=1 Tax=Tropilaelaps mercedesae TaxID=418985 RepID=A0A1V9Y3C6_9ACAR|nr:hypothetical protein BIW11_02428 [Tropilaelaps mercedesae]